MNDNIQTSIDYLLEEYSLSITKIKRVASEEAWKILQIAVAIAVTNIEHLASTLSGPDKKKIALNSINNFYDKVFVVVDVPFVPNILEPIIHKYIKTFLLILVGASIDATVATFRQIGFFKTSSATNLSQIALLDMKTSAQKSKSKPKTKRKTK